MIGQITRLERLIAIQAVCVCLVAVGCASKPPQPKPLPAVVVAALDLNPRESGEAQNLDVLIFQLADTDAFLNADLLDMYPGKDLAETALSGSLLGMYRYQFAPNERRVLSMEVDPETRYIGIVAAFAQYHRSTWRAVVQLQDDSLKDKVLFRNKRLHIKLEALSVQAQLGK